MTFSDFLDRVQADFWFLGLSRSVYTGRLERHAMWLPGRWDLLDLRRRGADHRGRLFGFPRPTSAPRHGGLNNRGVGLMGQFNYYDAAREILARLAAAHRDRLDLQVNLAIAT